MGARKETARPSSGNMGAARPRRGAIPVPSVLTVGQVAARSGVTVSTIRFYERKGLIQSSRTSGNQRRYLREVLRRLAVIKVAQRVGIPLDSIREALVSLPQCRAPNERDWAMLSARWRADLDDRISRLTALRDALTNCISCGCLSLESCPLYNARDRLGKLGPGARLLEPR
ncbi:MAG TPA: redox-sensitive transcriptional activator SoxR [Steroidobacteraceae bacterium]|nr:redox-sensitive transcriptional activator SoxR [Steroidobacteraceae bacterium]